MTSIAQPSWTIAANTVADGIWRAVLSPVGHPGEIAPRLKASHRGRPIDLTDPKREDGTWTLSLRLPNTMMTDGTQSLILTDAETGQTVGACHVAAGQPLDDDLLAEVSLLRAELDLLKRAFRKHCADTAE